MLGEASFTLFAVGPISGSAGSRWRCGATRSRWWPGSAWPRRSRPRGCRPAPSPSRSWRSTGLTVVAFCLWYRCVELLGAGRSAVLIGAMPVSGLVVALGAQPLTSAAVVGALVVSAGCVVGLKS
ncbi:hypothetical protein [Actinokineospora sp. HUAS TT18]|uniref:hypothetical protein n=1 Tax=Actinokineospora sp. HUAS TT18 TaxID=3447451 RepID=UPI003F521294